MQNAQKLTVKQALTDYISTFPSQNKAANSLKDVSSAIISHVLNDKWDQISDEMWTKISNQVGLNRKEWTVVQTNDYTALTEVLGDAQRNSNVYAVVGDAGTGKTAAIRSFREQNKKCYVLSCNEFWNRKYFLAELLNAMGQDESGLTVSEMMIEVVANLKKQSEPVIVMDEADKLTDQVLYFFITLYNQLEEQCGIVLCATNHLQKRIKRGLKLNKKGYAEIYSRIGKQFINLPGVGSGDIRQVCLANGITDEKNIKQITTSTEGDLRQVKKMIHAIKMLAA
jgi:Cdc6-like AAA superfamily ATPase